MPKTLRQILLDAERSIQMLLARDSIGMGKLPESVRLIHESHLQNLKTLLECTQEVSNENERL